MWKGTNWTRKSQYTAVASKRGGKAQNRPGKGNTNQMQVKEVEKHETDQEKAIQSRCKYIKGGKTQN
jgi:hypothetical protein